jgi:hypothetical protein
VLREAQSSHWNPTWASITSRSITNLGPPAGDDYEWEKAGARTTGCCECADAHSRAARSLVTDRMPSIGQSSGVFVHHLRLAILRRDRGTKRVHDDGARFSTPGWTRRRSSRYGSNAEYRSIVSHLRAPPSPGDSAKRSRHEEGARRRSTILGTGMDTAAWLPLRFRG